MSHSELFEVITDPEGSSTLSFRIACATAAEHYARTTRHDVVAEAAAAADTASPSGDSDKNARVAGDQEKDDNDVCSTGLRVYAGAQVLAAFLAQYGDAILHMTSPPPRSPPSSETPLVPSAMPLASSRVTAVELGCGCGLAGFALSAVTQRAVEAEEGDVRAPHTVQVVFTDASTDCLRLVREGGALNGFEVADGATLSSSLSSLSSSSSDSLACAARVTFPLDWGADGIAQLSLRILNRVPSQETSQEKRAEGTVNLVLGSDLFYYRVDIYQLLDTCKRLLCVGEDLVTSHGEGFFKLAALSHFMRIADGQYKVAKAARAMELGVVSVPLTAFLDQPVVWRAGFQGLELILLFPFSHACRAELSSSPALTEEKQHAADNGESDDADTRDARARGEEDVAYFQSQLDAVIAQHVSAERASSRVQDWLVQWRALRTKVTVYGLPASTRVSPADVASEENALLHMLSDF